MLQYNLKKQGNKNHHKNNLVRKNITQMNTEEVQAVESLLRNKVNLKTLKITKHCMDKGLLSLEGAKAIIKKHEIIDFNYLDNKDVRVVIRSKRQYQIKNINGKYENCYIKLVVDINKNTIVTMWANKVTDEEIKNNNLKNNYNKKLDILDIISNM